MNNFISKITKKRILMVSMVFSIAFFILSQKQISYSISSTNNDLYINGYKYLVLILVANISIFILSFILLFLKEKVFEYWKHFTLISMITYLIVLVVVPSSFEIHDDYFPIDKDNLMVFLLIIYFVLSIILITFQSFKKNTPESIR